MSRSQSNKQNVGLLLIIIVITLVGASVRTFLVLHYDFPLNDGGMFFQMVQDLELNNFRLPVFTSYNNSNIPYGYPPLPFYISALINVYLGIDLIDIFRFFPLVFSIFTIPAFFLLSKTMLESDIQTIHATLAFSIVTPGLEWLIMGGGLTRSPAYLFSILSLAISIRALKSNLVKYLILGSITLALTGYCHLEILWITVIFILISIPFIRSDLVKKIKIIFPLFTLSGIFLLPYVITIIRFHGIDPFINAFGTGDQALISSLGKFLLDNITGENLITPILLISILAFGQCIVRKDFWLPTLVIASVLFNSRSMERSVIVPLCLLFGLGIETLICSDFFRTKWNSGSIQEVKDKQINNNNLFPNKISAVFISFIIFRSLIGGPLFLIQDNSTISALSSYDRTAMQWVRDNKDISGDFLVLTPNDNWGTNEIMEWFPTLSSKKSILTVQGSEWLDDDAYSRRIQDYNEVLDCMDDEISCIDEVVSKNNIKFSFIYLSVGGTSGLFEYQSIKEKFVSSSSYELIYENKNVGVFTVH